MHNVKILSDESGMNLYVDLSLSIIFSGFFFLGGQAGTQFKRAGAMEEVVKSNRYFEKLRDHVILNLIIK